MKNNKTQIHQWSMIPYPRKLWVVKTKNPIELAETFYDSECEELSLTQTFEKINAFVMKAVHKETREMGYIVCIIRKMTVATCCHESFHVCDFLCDDIGLETSAGGSNEHYAYLIGWVADKIWQVNTNNVKE